MALSGVGVPRRGRGGSAEARSPAQSFVVLAEAAVEARKTSQGSPALAEPRRASWDLAEVRGTSQRSAGPRRGSRDLAEVRRRLNFLCVGPSQRSAESRRGSRDLAEVRGTSQKPAGLRRASLGFAEARLLSEKIRKGFFTSWSLVVAGVPSQRVRGRPCQQHHPLSSRFNTILGQKDSNF